MAMALIFAMMIAGCDSGSSSPADNPNPPPNPNTSEAGTYLGIIGFNDSLTEKDISLLDNDTKYQFQSFINGLQMKDATALYFAVDNAITRLQTAKLRSDVINVSIVTFTDGLDNASIKLNPQYTSRDDYRDAIHNRINTVKINNLPINAYSVGMRGSDVSDGEAFRNGIAALASSPDNFYELNNMTQMNEKFKEIAESLSNETKSQSIRLKIPGGYDDGIKMRFTFDNITDASRSNFYIDGIYRLSSSKLESIEYVGLNSGSGTTVTGEVNGVFIYFKFVNVSTTSGGSVPIDYTKQWTYNPTNSNWQINSEVGKEGNTETSVDKKSSVIMLILDCTNSLQASNFSNMKSVANNFINVLLGN